MEESADFDLNVEPGPVESCVDAGRCAARYPRIQFVEHETAR
jgi:hypothetical protein